MISRYLFIVGFFAGGLVVGSWRDKVQMELCADEAINAIPAKWWTLALLKARHRVEEEKLK